MSWKPQRVAVLGAGTMGSRIAAVFANAGMPVLLLDLAAEEPGNRNEIVNRGVLSAEHSKAFLSSRERKLVETGNFTDDWSRLANCQWIIEVITENLAIKRDIWSRIDAVRDPASIVSTNTSGLRLRDIIADCSQSLRQHFLATHFFNPPRVLHLLEMVRSASTLPWVFDAVRAYSEEHLGKGIVECRDTPNFVANRIGSFFTGSIERAMTRYDFTVDQIDVLTGPLIGLPKTATFRLLDLIGLDVWDSVSRNVLNAQVESEWLPWFETPSYRKAMIANGWLGEKSGQGFYKGRGTETQVLNLNTLQYTPPTVDLGLDVDRFKHIADLPTRLKTLLSETGRHSQFLWQILQETFRYSAGLVGTICNGIVDIDNAMRWGYGHQLGPFELWNALGVQAVAGRMQSEGLSVPSPVDKMLSAGVADFYRHERSATTYLDFTSQTPKTLAVDPRKVRLKARQDAQSLLAQNASASLVDIGDDVLCLQFRSKLNAIDEQTLVLIDEAVDRLDRNFAALVIANDGEMFSAGANLAALLNKMQHGGFEQIETFIRHFQQALSRLKHAPKPVIAAPFMRALGGGCEVVLHSHASQALLELGIGLVELRVGLIPAAGGCKEIVTRFPNVVAGLELILQGKVSNSAHEAKQMKLLRDDDRITNNPDFLIGDAKQLALDMAEGFVHIGKIRIRVSGSPGYQTMLERIETGLQRDELSPHDVVVARKLAWVLSGGDFAANDLVTEQHLYDLELEAFLSLCGMTATHDRIEHMLKSGKPLCN